MSSESVEASVGNKWCISGVWELCVCLLFDMLAAGHRVSHAGAGQDVHIVDDDEWFLLQGDDREVVFVGVFVPVRVVPRPHREHQRQRAVLPAPHLCVPQTQKQNQGLFLFLLCETTALEFLFYFFFYLLPLPFTIQDDDNQFGVGLVTIWSEGQVPPFVPYMHHVSESHRQERE